MFISMNWSLPYINMISHEYCDNVNSQEKRESFCSFPKVLIMKFKTLLHWCDVLFPNIDNHQKFRVTVQTAMLSTKIQDGSAKFEDPFSKVHVHFVITRCIEVRTLHISKNPIVSAKTKQKHTRPD